MKPSQEIKKKLTIVIGNLICRCIEQARYVPYLLDQDEIIEMLVRNPECFQKLVHEEQSDRTEYSSGTLTAKLDALAELAQFGAIDAFDMSFCGHNKSESDLAAGIEQVNQLTRTFNVYVENAIALFEKEFELFTEKLQDQLRRSGMTLRNIEFMPEDLSDLEKIAAGYLSSGQLIQAFMFERLLSCHVITKQFLSLPFSRSLGEKLTAGAIGDSALVPAVAKFILRVSYVSQGGWEDLFHSLVRLVSMEPDRRKWFQLIDFVEQDAMLCCNLMCESFSELNRRTPSERKSAIDRHLQILVEKAGCPWAIREGFAQV